MAIKVTGQVLGGEPSVKDDVDTVRDLLDAMGLEESYSASINGEPADLDDDLNDYDFVSFTEQVKGGSLG